MKLKEEDRAGLLYANDNYGNGVKAEDATSGNEYFCPVCGCKVHPVMNKYFARNAGSEHTDGRCFTYIEKNVRHTYIGVNWDALISSLCHLSPSSPNKGHGVTGDRTGKDDNTTEIEGKTIPFTSLRQLHEERDFLVSKLPDGRNLSDRVITPENANEVFCSGFPELGSRIIYCRFYSFNSKKSSIIFDIPCNGRYVKIHFVFSNSEDYKKYLDKFIEWFEDELGKQRWRKRKSTQMVMIACDNWTRLNHTACEDICFAKKCSLCIGMYQARYIKRNQIYIIP